MHFHKTVFSEKFSTDIARSSLYSFHPMLFTVFQSVTFIFPLYSPDGLLTLNLTLALSEFCSKTSEEITSRLICGSSISW